MTSEKENRRKTDKGMRMVATGEQGVWVTERGEKVTGNGMESDGGMGWMLIRRFKWE